MAGFLKQSIWLKLIFRSGLPAVLTLLLFVGSYWFIMKPAIEDRMIEARKHMTRELVNTAYHIVKAYGDQVAKGNMSLEDAQENAMNQLRSMRYGPEGKDYFWINDLVPVMIMHPWRRDLEDQVVGDFKDPNGNYLFLKFVHIANSTGEGFVEYTWQWKDDPNRFGQKLSYVKLYEPWGWIIGTGMYIEDVTNRIEEITRHLTITFAVIFSILIIVTGYIVIQSGRADLEARDVRNALLVNEAKYRAIFDSAFQFVTLLDGEGTVLEINERALQFAGINADQVVGTKFWETPWWSHSETERNKLRIAVEQCAQGRFIRFDTHHMNQNKSLALVDMSLKPLTDKFDQTQRILAEGRDITSLKRAEQESRFLRNFLKDTFDTMPSILMAVNQSCILTLWNRESAVRSGIPEMQALGRHLVSVLPTFEPFIPAILSVFGSRTPYSESRKELTLFTESRFYDVSIFPLSDPKNSTAVIRIDDVTDRVQIEEMMVQSEKMVSVGRLAAGMAHEINNPLAGILQNSQVLRNRLSMGLDKNIRTAESIGLDFEKLVKYLDARGIPQMVTAILESGKRASAIVTNMLSFSRKSDSNFLQHDVSEILDQSLELAANDYDLKKKYDFRKIRIIREYGSDVPPIGCDANQLQQVFLNIFKNGAQAMFNQTKEPPAFTLRISAQNTHVQIEIEDNGPGMPDDVRPRIFEPFYTTKSVGLGTGLGLSVSYFIITENHGGTMSVDSTVGVGTTFKILLPVSRRK